MPGVTGLSSGLLSKRIRPVKSRTQKNVCVPILTITTMMPAIRPTKYRTNKFLRVIKFLSNIVVYKFDTNFECLATKINNKM